MSKPVSQKPIAKTYVLGMFPYPSGDGLHVGHVRIYTAVDVMARYFRMKNRPSFAKASDGLAGEPMVLSPIGWDAFGLPAENAAIKNKRSPQDIVPRNYNNFRAQMKNLQFAFNWERELSTTDPTYYGLTQWIFLELYKKGLVYREQVPINWCPKCMTGLANEEVMADGTHERCGTVTGKKMLPQWVMKITKYADRLLEDLKVDLSKWYRNANEGKGSELPATAGGSKSSEPMGLDWPRGILEMQKNWIGKKEGVRVKFEIKEPAFDTKDFEVFTTRVDTIKGVTFVVIAPEVAQKWMSEGWKAGGRVEEYVSEALKKSEQSRLEEVKDKTGVETGLFAINPINHEAVPIYVADYVLAEYGTGCVMGVPQYDERDREFAVKYGLEIKNIPLDSYEEMFKILAKEKLAEKETTYHLRDWVFSRQRYWGEPIPLVFCENCGNNQSTNSNNQTNTNFQIIKQGDKNLAVVPIPERDLPLTLPYLESYEPTETGESPLSRVTEWVNTKCPKCGGEARRETDTMPNWAGSCWYHLAFAFWRGEQGGKGSELPKSSEPNSSTKSILQEYKKKSETPYSDFWKEVARPAIDKYLPVDWYLGGAEHAVLHLLYARYWNKVLFDLGHLSFPEPYLRLRSVGIVLAEDGRKMSKSWGNVINPDDVIKEYGSDSVRLYEMFMGPWDQAIAWDSRALVGMKRFLERAIEVSQNEKKKGETSSPSLVLKLARLIQQVERGILEQKFNTAIAGCMEFINDWRNKDYKLSEEHKKMFAQILSPFAPTTAQMIWEKCSVTVTQCHESRWPSLEEVAVGELPVTIAVQVNGKLRAKISVTSQMANRQEEVVKVALNDERVKKWVNGSPKKVIFVPSRLVNLLGE